MFHTRICGITFFAFFVVFVTRVYFSTACEEANAFGCGDGKCIPIGWKCDGKHDCVDHSDELNCHASVCPSDFFSCAAGGCVYASFRCDGSSDCHDDSDEVGCPHELPTACSPGYFRCNNSHCIPEAWRCDGELDCRDGSDEDFCSAWIPCNSKHEFTCANGRCLELDLVCDRDDDCGDGSDEANCDHNLQETKCPSSLYRCPESNHCILQSAVCDGYKNCSPRGEDEENCKTMDLSTHGCPEGMFQCLDKKDCIMSSWTCDGDHDCEDMSDETLDRCHVASTTTTTTVKPKQSGSHDVVTSTPSIRKPHLEDRSMTSTTTAKVDLNCPSDQFQCDKSRLCVSLDRLCDHRNDCPDRSDEGEFCTTACATDNGGCSDLCLATPTGPRCQCRTGHALDAETGKTCRDVNECLVPRICGQLCHNLDGTYACSCVSGYSLRPDNHSCMANGLMSWFMSWFLSAYSEKLPSSYFGDSNHIEVLALSQQPH